MSAAVFAEVAARHLAFENDARALARSAAALIGLENAARLNGLGVNSSVAWGSLRVPRASGEPVTTLSLADSIAAATTAEHIFVNLQN